MTSILATLCSCRFASRHSISVCYSRPPFVSVTVRLSASRYTRVLVPYGSETEGGRDGKIGEDWRKIQEQEETDQKKEEINRN